MSSAQLCPHCGGRLRVGSEGGLCARCLLALAGAGARSIDYPPGTRIGSCRLIRLLGEGGMGVVYLAQQDEPLVRLVAVKFVKFGMDTRAVLARFQAEQQALARMDHPGIARVFEAGCDPHGCPYFVMEYVPGIPITEYCDQGRLCTRARLELFLQVASAVQHAHQKGVIHRDLKPENILVATSDCQALPKVIDFGLARAIERDNAAASVFTQTGILIGTPEYMSPEQAASMDLDTRSDIYSLGVLLYELLVGATPFSAPALRSAGYDEMRRIIREDEPTPPAARVKLLGEKALEVALRRGTDAPRLRRLIRGDLDWITLKAIEKERERRYPTVSELSADIQRHLHEEPVTAALAGPAYRFARFLRRHRAAATAMTTLGVAILFWIGVSSAVIVNLRGAKQLAFRAGYAANLTTAALLLEDLHPSEARAYLQSCDPEFRGWEWRYLWARAAGAPHTLRVFRPPSGSEVRAIGFRADGRLVAATFSGTSGSIWEPGGGAAPARLPPIPGSVSAAAFNGDSSRLAVSSGSTIHIFETGAARLVRSLPAVEPVTAIAFASDGQTPEPGGSICAARLPDSLPSAAETAAACVSPGGRRIAAASKAGSIRILDARTFDLLLILPSPEPCSWTLFSPDNSRLAAASGRAILLWDTSSELPAPSERPWRRDYPFRPLER